MAWRGRYDTTLDGLGQTTGVNWGDLTVNNTDTLTTSPVDTSVSSADSGLGPVDWGNESVLPSGLDTIDLSNPIPSLNIGASDTSGGGINWQSLLQPLVNAGASAIQTQYGTPSGQMPGQMPGQTAPNYQSSVPQTVSPATGSSRQSQQSQQSSGGFMNWIQANPTTAAVVGGSVMVVLAIALTGGGGRRGYR